MFLIHICIYQGHIKLIKSDSKDFYIVTKNNRSNKLFVWTKTSMNFHKNIKQYKIKTKSAY